MSALAYIYFILLSVCLSTYIYIVLYIYSILTKYKSCQPVGAVVCWCARVVVLKTNSRYIAFRTNSRYIAFRSPVVPIPWYTTLLFVQLGRI